jgi:hypothetical protein
MLKRTFCKGQRTSVLAFLVAGCVLSGTTALAQQTEPPAAITEHGVTYLSGGVGEDESSAIRAMSPKYNLHMLFAMKSGMYLSDVDVVITSASGARIITMRSDGPMLFVRLLPGRYRISATTDDGVLDRWVTVPSRGGVDVNFYWG